MKRKEYATPRERWVDRIVGFLAFPLLNIPLWYISWSIRYEWPLLGAVLPWIVNAILLALAFLFRHEIAIGYISFIGFILIMSNVLSALYLAACFVIIFSVLALSNPTIGLSVLLGLIALGLLGLGVVAGNYIKRRRSKHQDTSH